MPYTHTTLGTLKAQLANRLGDSEKVFWVDTELGLYITEALRTWASLSSFWRERGTFATVASTAFYYIPANLSGNLRAYTVTDRQLIQLMQYHLLEDASSQSAWNGTEMFTLNDLTQALQRRLNQFLAETGVVVTRALQNVAGPPVGRIVLPDTTIDVRRVSWVDAAGKHTTLWRTDEFSLATGARGWSVNAAAPYAYSIMATPPLSVQIAPVPIDAGTLDLVLAQSSPILTPETAATVLNIPDDLTWVVKWGALADLLGKEGQAFDPARAAFCETQYQLGLFVAQQAPVVVNAEINGVPLVVTTLQSQDAAYPGWQGLATGVPTDIALAGLNLAFLRPVPNGVYSITLDVVRNAPIPSLDENNVELGREQLDAILDYAEHLAIFKVGGTEFTVTTRQAENFMRQALVYNERLLASTLFGIHVAGQSQAEEARRPRRKEVPWEAV